MKWYDFFSSFYDTSLEKMYFSSRARAAEILDLKTAGSVLDVACGTGVNFRHLKAVSPRLKIYGADFSKGMLTKAKKLVDTEQWNDITLFEFDARSINRESVETITGGHRGFERIICSLGLSTIPSWELVMDNLVDLLEPGGRIVIMDVYADPRNINSWLVEKMAKADLNRKIWQRLENKVSDFSVEYMPVSEIKMGGKLFVATGVKGI